MESFFNTDVNAPPIKLLRTTRSSKKSDSKIIVDVVPDKKATPVDKKITPWVFMVPAKADKKKLTKRVARSGNCSNPIVTKSDRKAKNTNLDQPTTSKFADLMQDYQ